MSMEINAILWTLIMHFLSTACKGMNQVLEDGMYVVQLLGYSHRCFKRSLDLNAPFLSAYLKLNAQAYNMSGFMSSSVKCVVIGTASSV